MEPGSRRSLIFRKAGERIKSRVAQSKTYPILPLITLFSEGGIGRIPFVIGRQDGYWMICRNGP
jgi:hypothetical protein